MRIKCGVKAVITFDHTFDTNQRKSKSIFSCSNVAVVLVVDVVAVVAVGTSRYCSVYYVLQGTICVRANPLYVVRAGSHLIFGFEKVFGILKKDFPI